MRNIDGRITIFEQLDNIAARGICYPYALTAGELFSDIRVAVNNLLHKKPCDIPVNGQATYLYKTDLGIDSYDEEGNITLRIIYPKHCVILYPKSLGELNAIYNLGKKGYELENILDDWKLEEINYNGVDYYLYYQKVRVLAEDTEYKFIFKTNREN